VRVKEVKTLCDVGIYFTWQPITARNPLKSPAGIRPHLGLGDFPTKDTSRGDCTLNCSLYTLPSSNTYRLLIKTT
jgi:hypothetical protein